MIGTNLNLDLPTLSDTLATIVSKTVTALGLIQDSIADKATPSALNITSALSLAGNQLTNVASATLTDGNNATVAGTIYYHNNEFYLVDGTGTIQLTSAGAINVSSTGTIGGDYGGSNPANVTYVNATAEYLFKKDGTTYADIVAEDYHHIAAWERELVLMGQVNLGSVIINHGSIPSDGGLAYTAGAWSFQTTPLPLRVGDRVTGFKIIFKDKSAGTFSIELDKWVALSATTIQSFTNTATGAQSVTFTITSPVTVATGETYKLFMSGPGAAGAGTANGDCVTDIIIFVDHP